MDRDMILARVTRALGVAGYTVEECDEITSQLFSVPPREPREGERRAEVNVTCYGCGSLLRVMRVMSGLGGSEVVPPCSCWHRAIQEGRTFPSIVLRVWN